MAKKVPQMAFSFGSPPSVYTPDKMQVWHVRRPPAVVAVSGPVFVTVLRAMHALIWPSYPFSCLRFWLFLPRCFSEGSVTLCSAAAGRKMLKCMR